MLTHIGSQDNFKITWIKICTLCLKCVYRDWKDELYFKNHVIFETSSNCSAKWVAQNKATNQENSVQWDFSEMLLPKQVENEATSGERWQAVMLKPFVSLKTGVLQQAALESPIRFCISFAAVSATSRQAWPDQRNHCYSGKGMQDGSPATCATTPLKNKLLRPITPL